MDVGRVIMFAPGTEVQILRGNNPDENLIPVAEKYVIISYDDFGIMVRATTGPALGRSFYVSRATPIIMMEAD